MKRQTAYGLAIGVGGVATAWALAVGLGDSALAGFELVLLAAGTSLAFSLVGLGLIVALRRQAFAVLLWISIVFTMCGVAGGVAIAGQVMFLSATDSRAVIVMLFAAGTVSVVSALLIGSRMGAAIRQVATKASTHLLSRDMSAAGTIARPPTLELSILVDELDQAFSSIQSAREHERALETSRRELIAWISHDLRTPLGGIRAMAEAIEDGVVDNPETVSRYHHAIINEVQRLTSMVNDLFRLSQIHAGLLRLDFAPVKLTDLISDALSLASPVAEANGVILSAKVAAFDRVLDLSTSEFLRVMRNLLDNAISHTPSGGRVTVAVDTNGIEAIVDVRDSCGGIPPGDLTRVFELGFRGDVARSPVDGTHAGLGLAIAKGLVDAHGGTIDVANHPDGCSFTIKLPIVSPGGEAMAASLH